MNRRNPYRHLISLVAISLVLSVAANRRPKSGGENHFRVNLGTEPPSLDWSIATDHVSFNVISNLMVGLTEFDKELKPAPVIAKSWELSRRRQEDHFQSPR